MIRIYFSWSDLFLHNFLRSFINNYQNMQNKIQIFFSQYLDKYNRIFKNLGTKIVHIIFQNILETYFYIFLKCKQVSKHE